MSASPRQGELTHMRSMCVGVAETGTMQILCIKAKGIRADSLCDVIFTFKMCSFIPAKDMIFHRLEGFFAYHMLYFAGVLGRCLTVYTKADKKV